MHDTAAEPTVQYGKGIRIAHVTEVHTVLAFSERRTVHATPLCLPSQLMSVRSKSCFLMLLITTGSLAELRECTGKAQIVFTKPDSWLITKTSDRAEQSSSNGNDAIQHRTTGIDVERLLVKDPSRNARFPERLLKVLDAELRAIAMGTNPR